MLKVHAFGGSRLQPCISRASGSLTSNFHGEFYYGTLRKLNLEPEGKLLLGHSCKLRIHFGARPSTVYTKLQLNHFSLSQHQHQQLAPRVDCASSCCRCLCTSFGAFRVLRCRSFPPFLILSSWVILFPPISPVPRVLAAVMATSTILARSGSRCLLQSSPSSRLSRNALQRLPSAVTYARSITIDYIPLANLCQQLPEPPLPVRAGPLLCF